MKTLALTILLIICGAGYAQNSGNIQICWLPGSGTPLGYHVHIGTTSGIYGMVLDVGNVNTATIKGLPAGTYYAVVSAYYPEEGPLSNEFVYVVIKHKKP